MLLELLCHFAHVSPTLAGKRQGDLEVRLRNAFGGVVGFSDQSRRRQYFQQILVFDCPVGVIHLRTCDIEPRKERLLRLGRERGDATVKVVFQKHILIAFADARKVSDTRSFDEVFVEKQRRKRLKLSDRGWL